MVGLKALEFGEAGDEEPCGRTGGFSAFGPGILAPPPLIQLHCDWLTVHGVFLIGEQLGQGPECILLVHVHQQDGGDLAHPLAVTHFLWREGPGVRNSYNLLPQS